MTDTTSRIGRRAEQAAGGDWKQTLGRIGLVGKGVVSTLVGVLAVRIATGDVGTDASKVGAVEYVARQPFGRFLLVALTAALFAMAAWRLLEVVTGDPVEGDEPKDRAKYAIVGVLYLSLAVSALSITMANWGKSTGGGGGGGGSQERVTDQVLDWPAGRWLVALVGALVIAYGLYTIKRHVVDKGFLERLRTSEDSPVTRLGQAGYLARAIIYAIVGIFLVRAAIAYDADKANGLSESLRSLAGSSWGQALLWVVALGLIAFGVFTLAEVRLRRAT